MFALACVAGALVATTAALFAIIAVDRRADRTANGLCPTPTPVSGTVPSLRRIVSLRDAQVLDVGCYDGELHVSVLPASISYRWVAFDGTVMDQVEIEPDVFTLRVLTGGRLGRRTTKLFEQWTTRQVPLTLAWDLDANDQGPVQVSAGDESIVLA